MRSPSGSASRPLDGWIIGISVANSQDIAQQGYTAEDVNRATVRLSEALLAAGARLVFGHDWRPDGVMEAICRSAVSFQSPVVQGSARPLIQNLLPWPNQPALNPERRHDLEQRGVLKVESIGMPACSWVNPEDPIARAIALTHMRRELATRTHGRVCLGGNELGADGFFAGVIEEAYNTAVAGQPVYLASFLGGAAARLVGAIQRPAPKPSVLRLLQSKEDDYRKVQSQAPELIPPEDLTSAFETNKLQAQSGLNEDDWIRLVNSPDVESFSTLVIRGLRTLSHSEPPQNAEARPASPGKARRRKD